MMVLLGKDSTWGQTQITIRHLHDEGNAGQCYRAKAIDKDIL